MYIYIISEARIQVRPRSYREWSSSELSRYIVVVVVLESASFAPKLDCDSGPGRDNVSRTAMIDRVFSMEVFLFHQDCEMWAIS